MLQRAIAIDFDGCLCDEAYPEIGAPHWDIIAKAKQEQENGAGLILWTCREGKFLQDALDACESWGLHFDAVNESLPSWIEYFGVRSRKVGANEYWDDKAKVIRTTDAIGNRAGKMERLTYFDNGKWRLTIGETEYSGNAVDRLAAYENTGLEPEQIRTVLDDDNQPCTECSHYRDAVEAVEPKAGKIIETIKDGRMYRICSCCAQALTGLTSWCMPNYCPNCGTPLEKEIKKEWGNA